jgi:uncharacterized protein
MDLLPNEDAILRLHKKYTPHECAFAVVYSHCQIVAEIAAELIAQKQLQLDSNLIHVAALLHDIGYYPLFDPSGYVPKDQLITHGVVGAELLRKEGLPETICRIAECHTGVGLTRETILKQQLPLPGRDFVPQTAEEWLIAYADKLHSKSTSPDEPHDATGYFNRPESYLEHAGKFGEANAARFAELIEQYGVPDLRQLADKHHQRLL